MQQSHPEYLPETTTDLPVPADSSSAESQSADTAGSKICSRCGEYHPLSHYARRTGRKSGKSQRRGTCRSCRKQLKNQLGDTPETVQSADKADVHVQPISAPTSHVHAIPAVAQPSPETQPTAKAMHITAVRPNRQLPSIDQKDIRGQGLDLSILRPTRKGIVYMRGRTDKGRRWHQESDLETAIVLVREYAAVVVNKHTIRRLYSNRAFRRYILERDQYTCYFCGGYGDTLDHLLPRARGGHTTPLNCVCACNLCNQAKADHDLSHFIQPESTESLPGSD
ncbi:HNH endonuclease [Paenibacillus bovis]|uniref:HNH endonuclease n=1 Tax=Paenibacillus bovis TaxID=1616788 RepID=UPI00076100FE|nr:HNH endonuclease [Paenibacillus bovis]